MSAIQPTPAVEILAREERRLRKGLHRARRWRLRLRRKMVKVIGPLSRTLSETLMVAIQGKIRTWIRGKPTVRDRRCEHSHHANKAEGAALRPLAQVDGWQARHDEQAAQQHTTAAGLSPAGRCPGPSRGPSRLSSSLGRW